MKPGGVVVLKRVNLFKFFGKYRLLILLLLLFVAGFALSNFSSATSKAAALSNELFNSYISVRKHGTFISILFTVFFQYFALIITLFIAGSSLTGVVSAPLICCTLGLYFGSMVSLTYSSYSLKGIAFNSVILIPPALVLILCVFFAAREAFIFSTVLLRVTMPKSRAMNLSGEFKTYCGKYLLFVLLSLLAALIDAAVSVSFIKYFSFI
ncbi:MAG: hypothetical protein J6T73_03910 [Clostridia bacterium]|nr:hypothetical protein [Clostridia bacterium]